MLATGLIPDDVPAHRVVAPVAQQPASPTPTSLLERDNLSSAHGRPPGARSATETATSDAPGRLPLPDKPDHAGPARPETGIALVAESGTPRVTVRSALVPR